MQPLLSIITINYNDAIGLQKTIISVVTQSFKDFEYLIIDGNSNDGSKTIIEKYKNNIHFAVSEPDTGIYNAMNKGITIAKGKYLLFLNSGDILNGTKALFDFVNHTNFEGDIIYGDYQFKEGSKVYPDYLTPHFFMRTSLPHQSTFFKREVFDAMGFYDEKYKIVSDRAFYIKCFLSNQFKFRHIHYPLSVFDLSGISNDLNFKIRKEAEDEQVFKEYYSIYYEDYKNMIILQNRYNQLKKQTISGIFKRIKNKIEYLCKIR